MKKYYDVFKDEFMYLPPVAKALIDYTLLEEAEKHYVDEEDEFPDFYSGCLRAVASNHLDEDMDYEYLYDIAVPIDGIVVQDSSPADAPVQADPNDTVTELEKQVTDKPAIDPNKERSLRIETELNEIIQETETEELGEEMEPEAIAALHKGVSEEFSLFPRDTSVYSFTFTCVGFENNTPEKVLRCFQRRVHVSPSSRESIAGLHLD